jgi:hypothetical protein
LQCTGNEIGVIIHPLMSGGWVLMEQLINGGNPIHYLAAPADTNGQASTTKFVDNIEEFQSAAIHRLV